MISIQCNLTSARNPWIWREKQRGKGGGALIGLSYSEIRFLSKSLVNKFSIYNSKDISLYARQQRNLWFIKYNIEISLEDLIYENVRIGKVPARLCIY